MKPNFEPIDLTTLPQILGKGYSSYEEGLMGRDPIDFCKYCREEYAKNSTEFWPLCNGSVLDGLTDEKLADVPEHERALIRATADPVAWASINLHWDADWYQSQFLRCTSLSKVCRWGRRSGKCLEEGTLIMTPEGPRPIELLEPGDTVYAYNTKDDSVSETRVLEVHDQGMQEVVDLFRHGKSAVACTAEHRWHTTYDDSRRIKKVRRLHEFNKHTAITRRFVDVPMGTEHEPHAYAIGALLGDGCSRERGTCLYISSESGHVPSKVASILGAEFCYPTAANNYTWVISHTGKDAGHSAKVECANYDVWCRDRRAHEKTCDLGVVRRWDRESCLAFLAGLLDTDGAVTVGESRIAISWSMQSKDVLDVVQHLLMALFQYDAGMYVDNRPRYVNGPVYSVSISNNVFCKRVLKELDPWIVTERKRWRDAYEDLPTNNEAEEIFGVRFDINNTRTAHCYDISVDTEDNLYLTAQGLVTHNTDALCIHALHKAMTRPGKKPYQQFTILVVTPYENQVNRIFGVLRNLISRSPKIEAAVAENVKNPQLITFRNGSLIKGFTAGVKSGNKSEKIRGEDADEILLDESDLLTKDDLEAIIAIRGSHPRCGIIFSTTPSGKRETFYEVCTVKDKRFKEFWRASHESPRYTSVTEEMFHKMYTTAGYAREILAQFGELEEGVYQKKYVDAAIKDYKYPDGPQPGLMYIMGVDWNDHTFGTHIVINEWDPEAMQFRVVYKEIVQGGEYTQTKSVQRIIDLNHHWNPKYVALDAGYGTMAAEVLKMVGLRDPSSGLARKLQSYNMSSKIIIRDPLSGTKMKKHIKPQMVDWTIRVMEQGEQIFPVFEDDKTSKGLVHQIRSYKRERISPDGRPVYSQGYDHTLTAWALTILMWNLEETDINVRTGSTRFTKLGTEVDEDGDMYLTTEDNKTPAQMTLRTHQANRGGLIPEKQTVRGQLSRMRKRMRPTSRRTF